MTHWYNIHCVEDLWRFGATVAKYRSESMRTNPKRLHRFARRVLEVHILAYNASNDPIHNQRQLHDSFDFEVGRLWTKMMTRGNRDVSDLLVNFVAHLKYEEYHQVIIDSGEYLAYILAGAGGGDEDEVVHVPEM